jgi:hypothetical protein
MNVHERSRVNKGLRAGVVGEGWTFPTKATMLDSFRGARATARKDSKKDAIEDARDGDKPYKITHNRGVNMYFLVDGDYDVLGAEFIDWDLRTSMAGYAKQVQAMVGIFGDRLTEVSLNEQYDCAPNAQAYEDGDYFISDHEADVKIWINPNN